MKTTRTKTRTPARVCLFGDHQDYLGLPVIACAIDRYISIKSDSTEFQGFHISMPDIGEERYIRLAQFFDDLAPRDYFGAAIRVLREKGVVFDHGYDVTIRGDIPINSGLSSSTAVCLAWIKFLYQKYSDEDLNPEKLAQLGYQIEVLEHGEPGGMMDQYSIAYGGVIHLTTSEPYKVMSIDVDIPGLVIGDSGVEKKTIDVLRQARSRGLDAIAQALKYSGKLEAAEITYEELDELLPQLSEDLRLYLRAAVGNHGITKDAFEALNASDPNWKRIGELMNQHQGYLRDDLKVSIPQLDRMIDAALQAGALGAKLVGSGGGGCVVALAPGKEEEVKVAMIEAGAFDAFDAIVVQPKIREA